MGRRGRVALRPRADGVEQALYAAAQRGAVGAQDGRLVAEQRAAEDGELLQVGQVCEQREPLAQVLVSAQIEVAERSQVLKRRVDALQAVEIQIKISQSAT